MWQKKNNKIALVLTIAFHGILLILALFFGLKYPDPPPPEEGITITFGEDLAGKSSVAPVVTPPPPEPEVVEPEPEEVTQTDEPTVAIKKKKKVKKVKKVKKKKKKVSKNVSKALDALNRNKKTNSNKGDTKTAGNQGAKVGPPNTKNFKGGGSNNGIKFSLEGRSIASFKKPTNDSQESGIVVVDILVNSAGVVIKASPGARGSTTSSQALYKKAIKAAYKARFSTAGKGGNQKGQITFIFILN